MKWSNLKLNKCPKCNKTLGWSTDGRQVRYVCNCGFGISEKRMSEIISSQVNKSLSDKELEEKLQQEEDNL